MLTIFFLVIAGLFATAFFLGAYVFFVLLCDQFAHDQQVRRTGG